MFFFLSLFFATHLFAPNQISPDQILSAKITLSTIRIVWDENAQKDGIEKSMQSYVNKTMYLLAKPMLDALAEMEKTKTASNLFNGKPVSSQSFSLFGCKAEPIDKSEGHNWLEHRNNTQELALFFICTKKLSLEIQLIKKAQLLQLIPLNGYGVFKKAISVEDGEEEPIVIDSNCNEVDTTEYTYVVEKITDKQDPNLVHILNMENPLFFANGVLTIYSPLVLELNKKANGNDDKNNKVQNFCLALQDQINKTDKDYDFWQSKILKNIAKYYDNSLFAKKLKINEGEKERNNKPSIKLYMPKEIRYFMKPEPQEGK